MTPEHTKTAETIPADIKQVANDIMDNACLGTAYYWNGVDGALRSDIARAILAERETALRIGYQIGFSVSGEGWNGEYPGIDYDRDDYWIKSRDRNVADALGVPSPPEKVGSGAAAAHPASTLIPTRNGTNEGEDHV
jgi:hypothetical protein